MPISALDFPLMLDIFRLNFPLLTLACKQILEPCSSRGSVREVIWLQVKLLVWQLIGKPK